MNKNKNKKSFLSFVPYFLGGLIVGMSILNFDALSGGRIPRS